MKEKTNNNEITMKGIVDESKFNMWRACFSISFIDGKISPEEKEWIKEKVFFIPFTDMQREILLKDFYDRTSYKDFLREITNPPDLAFLVYLARVVSALDGVYSEKEKESFNELEQFALSKVDLNQIESTIEKERLDEMNKHPTVFNKASLFEKYAKYILG